jgi:GGDEF domain-containing protein
MTILNVPKMDAIRAKVDLQLPQPHRLSAAGRIGGNWLRPALDPLTRLPGPAAAHAVMEAFATEDTQAFAVVFSVLRIQQIISRYGAAAGDEVMEHVAASLASGFSPPDRLFRWHGLAFVAMLRRTEPVHSVQREIRRLIHIKLKHELLELNIDGRSVMVAVNCASAVFPVAAPVTVLKTQIEQFLAFQCANSTVVNAS